MLSMFHIDHRSIVHFLMLLQIKTFVIHSQSSYSLNFLVDQFEASINRLVPFSGENDFL